jgi:hypothetical protein
MKQKIIIYSGCILLSELGRHEDGLQYGKKAAKKCVSHILDSMSICYHQLLRLAKAYALPTPHSSSQRSRPGSKGAAGTRKRTASEVGGNLLLAAHEENVASHL